MRLVLGNPILKRLHSEMRRARQNEIGGVLLGEHVGHDTFRVVDITVQHSGGSSTHFLRDPSRHQAQLDEFFERTAADFTRYNYLGEWHSHPSFAPLPSAVDVETMQAIVESDEVGVNFAVLVIARGRLFGSIQLSATLFRPASGPEPVKVVCEGEVTDESGALRTVGRWMRRFISG